MNEISKVIRYYLMEVQKDKDSPHLWIKYEKTFLKYFADQMKDNFPGRRMRNGGWTFTDTNTTNIGFNTTGTAIDNLTYSTDSTTSGTTTLFTGDSNVGI